MHKKRTKICTGCKVSELKMYLYHSTKIAKARTHRVECPTDSSVQKQWSMAYQIILLVHINICMYCNNTIHQKSNVIH